MNTRTTNLKQTLTMTILGLAMLVSLSTAAPLLAADAAASKESEHGGHENPPAKLVQAVRNATRQFINGPGPGYEPFLGCVSGPDHGAMGVHYVNGDLVKDGEIKASEPEALIYEPTSDGRIRLVGVEYIVDAATWLSHHHNTPPVLEGQTFQLVGSPNRYALDPFFELHVWAWRDNPNGAFVDWNTRVSCENSK